MATTLTRRIETPQDLLVDEVKKAIYRLSGCAQQQDEQTVPMDDCPSQEGIAYLSVISVGGLFVILIDKEKH